MTIVRRIVLGLAGGVVLAMVLALASPKSVHALVSTLVTVANTPNNPVPTRETDAANSFYASGDCFFPAGSPICSFAVPLYNVPAGSVAVTDSVSTACLGPVAIAFFRVTTDGGQKAVIFAPPRVAATTGGTWTGGAQNLKFYASAGSIQVEADATSAQPPTGQATFCFIGVSGHLVPAN